MNTEHLLSEFEKQDPKPFRRSLLPLWMKIFVWLFLVFGAFAVLSLLGLILGFNFQLSIYGLETETAASLTGVTIILIFLFKAVVAYLLWTGHDKAITAGYIDATCGIAFCLFVMFILPFIENNGGFQFKFRMELVVLILYLRKLQQIETNWKN